MEREKLASRLGFLLLSAGCAIGLGNVWRFPYITGVYGGGAFVFIYLFFLAVLGIPIMVMEFAMGRASQKSIAMAFDVLEPTGTKWHWYKYFAMSGNYLLMMFYTTVGGWVLYYFFKMAAGSFSSLSAPKVTMVFSNMLSRPLLMGTNMAIVVLACFGINALGLQKGVERVTKAMMLMLFVIMVVLAVRTMLLPKSLEGIKFYLYPDIKRLTQIGIWPTITAAMGQAFFTLSLGIGSLAIFGSYIDKSRSLLGEAIYVAALDTAVALIAGLIIFPACFSFDVKPDSGPSLLFITLPNVFNAMGSGRIWGTLFFLFLFFAAASSIIAVFENIISFAMDLTGCSRRKAVFINLLAMLILSLPCVLGFNVLKSFVPLGPGTNVLDLEDFLVSSNLLPIGSIVFLLFCTSRYGWGFQNFMQETNMGNGLQFPRWARVYVSLVLPIIVLLLFIQGYLAIS